MSLPGRPPQNQILPAIPSANTMIAVRPKDHSAGIGCITATPYITTQVKRVKTPEIPSDGSVGAQHQHVSQIDVGDQQPTFHLCPRLVTELQNIAPGTIVSSINLSSLWFAMILSNLSAAVSEARWKVPA